MTKNLEMGPDSQHHTDWNSAEVKRRNLEAETGKYVGWNDPNLPIEHAERYSEQNPGASGVEDGFFFGGRIYRSADEARARHMTPEQRGDEPNQN